MAGNFAPMRMLGNGWKECLLAIPGTARTAKNFLAPNVNSATFGEIKNTALCSTILLYYMKKIIVKCAKHMVFAKYLKSILCGLIIIIYPVS
jgi:hypothetical protein